MTGYIQKGNIMNFFSNFNLQEIVSAFLVIFAAVDAIGCIPPILNAKSKGRTVDPKKGTIYATIMLFGFFYIGEAFLSLFGLDIPSFAVAGSLVIFFFGMEMILDIEIFKTNSPTASQDATFIPVVFPLLTGAGVLTTVLSIRSQYQDINMIIAMVANIGVIAFILTFVEKIQKILGKGVIYMMQKFFGIILLAISLKLFITNVTFLVEHINIAQ